MDPLSRLDEIAEIFTILTIRINARADHDRGTTPEVQEDLGNIARCQWHVRRLRVAHEDAGT